MGDSFLFQLTFVHMENQFRMWLNGLIKKNLWKFVLNIFWKPDKNYILALTIINIEVEGIPWSISWNKTRRFSQNKDITIQTKHNTLACNEKGSLGRANIC